MIGIMSGSKACQEPASPTDQASPALYLKQFTKLPNAGDVASENIVSHLLKSPVAISGDTPLQAPNLIAIGSILHWADRNSIIWGTGLISQDTRLRARPAKIVALRGHLTRNRLTADGVRCPELVGDPGVLITDVFAFDRLTPRGVGIVPHYMDRDEGFVAYCLERGAVLIDPLASLESYLAAISSCEVVISSSLHGLIFAHAYGRAAVC
jgi:pyruvyltransferase